MVKIKSIKYVGKQQTYDLEIDHEDHQFYMHNGLLTSNSHSVAYSLNGYDTGWYKLYFTAPFMAAVLKSEASKGGTDRDSQIRACKAEAKRLGVKILPPDINMSDANFYATDSQTIMTGLEAIKGIGQSAVNNILQARKEQKFQSFADFMLRTDSRYVRKDVIEALAKAGCFDSFKITRKNAVELYQDVRKKVNDFYKKNKDEGKSVLHILNDFNYGKYTTEEFTLKEILEGEKETLGEYISGNINDVYEGFFQGIGSKIGDIKNMSNNQTLLIEAVVMDSKVGKLKKGANAGKSFGKFMVSDQNNASIEMTLWPEQYLRFKDKLLAGKPIRAKCKVNDWNGNKSLVLEELIAVG